MTKSPFGSSTPSENFDAMARLRIRHQTIYRYRRPVAFGRHRLVIRPREGHDVFVESLKLTIQPAHQITWIRDIFGNSVAIVDFHARADELVIENDVTIGRRLPFPDISGPEPWQISYPVVYDVLEAAATAPFLTPNFPDDVEIVRGWLNSLPFHPDANDAEAYLLRIGEHVHKTIRYQRRLEKGVQTPTKTLELRTGSCRDLATLTMEAARTAGIASRFVSGYLDCRASEAGRAAMHAWVEFYLPTLGWRGYDPTLGEPTSLKHVTVGVSNHPRGVMPVSGMFTGNASETLQMIAQVQIDKIG